MAIVEGQELYIPSYVILKDMYPSLGPEQDYADWINAAHVVTQVRRNVVTTRCLTTREAHHFNLEFINRIFVEVG